VKTFLGIVPPKKLGPKNYLFLTTSQLSGNFEGQSLRWGTQYRTLRKLWRVPYTVPKFVNFGSLMAKNVTLVFHTPSENAAWANGNNDGIPAVVKLPTSSAWWRWPSCWLPSGVPTFLVPIDNNRLVVSNTQLMLMLLPELYSYTEESEFFINKKCFDETSLAFCKSNFGFSQTVQNCLRFWSSGRALR